MYNKVSRSESIIRILILLSTGHIMDSCFKISSALHLNLNIFDGISYQKRNKKKKLQIVICFSGVIKISI